MFLKRAITAGFLVAAAASGALASNFEAAVIGNVSYPAAPLANAARDAEIVAQALAESGFSVSTYLDVPRADMEQVLSEIKAQFEGAKIGVLYFAGHAFQFNGQNQLLAVDVDALTAEQINEKRVPLNEIISSVIADTDATESLRLVIVDACRNDPFSTLDDAFAGGLSYEEGNGTQTLVAYSTSAGALALDGPRGGNGPYALALSRALRSKGATVSSAMRSVRRDVRLATEGLQIPWVVGSIEIDPLIGPDAEAEQPEIQATDIDGPSVDEVLWYFLRNDLTTDGLREFVQNFPQSAFIEAATRRINTIRDVSGEQIAQLGDTSVTRSTLRGLARASELANTTSVYDIDATIPAELFALWPDSLPSTTDGLEHIVHQCDVLTSDPADPQRVAPPTRDGLVNLRNAARACAAALKSEPTNPRFLFQFGRILDIAGRYDWAKSYYNRASIYGYSAALTNLGYMAIRGRGGPKDYDAARKFYMRASEMGNLRARTNVGTMFIRGQGRDSQPEEGVLWYRLASGMGWVNAQNALADLYRKGIGVDSDPKAALALYHLAAANGQRDAMNSLGRSYANGWGTEKDRAQSHIWFERAIAAGDRYAPRFYAQDLIAAGVAKEDPDRILDLFALSARRGFMDGYRELAKVYFEGKIVPQDLEAAYRNARLAELGRVKKIEELITEIRAALPADVVDGIDADIENQRRLNGL